MISGIRRAIAVSVFVTGFAVTPAWSGFDDKNPINYTVDGATATGYFKVVTEALNGMVRDAYPGSAATFKPGSPAGGIQAISTGQADLIFTAGAPEIAHALEGKAPFQSSLKGKFSFVMLLHNGLVVYSVMTKDWADRHGVKSFADIAAKKPTMRLAVNQIANLQSTLSMYVALFDVHGINEAEVTGRGGNVFRANSNNGLEAMRDGKIDVFINGGFLPASQIVDLARTRPLLWITATPEKIKEAASRWGNELLTVPKSAYTFLNQDETTIVQWNAVLAGAHVSDETIYKFVKALGEKRDQVRTIHPSLAEFAIDKVARNPTELPHHPGATRYYREIGALK